VVYGLIKSRLSKMKLRPIFKNRRVIVFVIDLVLRVNLNLSVSCFNLHLMKALRNFMTH
jgi:hypothetical protein